MGDIMRKPKTTRGRAQDRRLVAGGQGYEVNYFATKHGITREQAREIIGRVGNDRAKLNAAAEASKKRGARSSVTPRPGQRSKVQTAR
jgi:hypothetical protein